MGTQPLDAEQRWSLLEKLVNSLLDGNLSERDCLIGSSEELGNLSAARRCEDVGLGRILGHKLDELEASLLFRRHLVQEKLTNGGRRRHASGRLKDRCGIGIGEQEIDELRRRFGIAGLCSGANE